MVRGMSVAVMVGVAEESEETNLCAHQHLRRSDCLGFPRDLYSLFLLLCTEGKLEFIRALLSVEVRACAEGMCDAG